MREFKWWTRWFLRYFPGMAYRRVRYCNKNGHGTLYDAHWCLRCGAPWFRDWRA